MQITNKRTAKIKDQNPALNKEKLKLSWIQYKIFLDKLHYSEIRRLQDLLQVSEINKSSAVAEIQRLQSEKRTLEREVESTSARVKERILIFTKRKFVVY